MCLQHHRLTQSTPFIEQETTNIVERILTRQVEWGLLQAQEVSELGTHLATLQPRSLRKISFD